MKNKKRMFLLIIAAVCLPLLNAPSAMSFCKSGCNHYIYCKIHFYVKEDNSFLNVQIKRFERAVPGSGEECNFFGCNCDHCIADKKDAELLSWCKNQYDNTARDMSMEWCKKANDPEEVKYYYEMKHKDTDKGKSGFSNIVSCQ